MSTPIDQQLAAHFGASWLTATDAEKALWTAQYESEIAAQCEEIDRVAAQQISNISGTVAQQLFDIAQFLFIFQSAVPNWQANLAQVDKDTTNSLLALWGQCAAIQAAATAQKSALG